MKCTLCHKNENSMYNPFYCDRCMDLVRDHGGNNEIIRKVLGLK